MPHFSQNQVKYIGWRVGNAVRQKWTFPWVPLPGISFDKRNGQISNSMTIELKNDRDNFGVPCVYWILWNPIFIAITPQFHNDWRSQCMCSSVKKLDGVCNR